PLRRLGVALHVLGDLLHASLVGELLTLAAQPTDQALTVAGDLFQGEVDVAGDAGLALLPVEHRVEVHTQELGKLRLTEELRLAPLAQRVAVIHDDRHHWGTVPVFSTSAAPMPRPCLARPRA